MNNKRARQLRFGANNSRILLSLDGMPLHEAYEIGRTLSPYVAGGKANDLIDKGGASVLNPFGFQIRFLDPKINDIGATVYNRLMAYKDNAELVTVHAAMSNRALSKAVDASIMAKIALIGVTVLTDIDSDNCESIFGTGDVRQKVDEFAQKLIALDFHGIVCSPQETRMIRDLSKNIMIINPGVRSSGADVNDQIRVATPYNAILDGADLLVIGRQVLTKETTAEMIAEIKRINAEVSDALTKRAA